MRTYVNPVNIYYCLNSSLRRPLWPHSTLSISGIINAIGISPSEPTRIHRSPYSTVGINSDNQKGLIAYQATEVGRIERYWETYRSHSSCTCCCLHQSAFPKCVYIYIPPSVEISGSSSYHCTEFIVNDNMNYPNLSQPGRLGSINLRHRWVFMYMFVSSGVGLTLHVVV